MCVQQESFILKHKVGTTKAEMRTRGRKYNNENYIRSKYYIIVFRNQSKISSKIPRVSITNEQGRDFS